MATHYPLNGRREEAVTTLPAIGGSESQFFAKRCLDVAVASCALIGLSPLFAVVGILIKLDSPGPIFFIQPRVGSRRRAVAGRIEWIVEDFRMFKFRSMVQDASEHVHRSYIEAYANNRVSPDDGLYKLNRDSRITRVGHWLRRSSIDELPQLLNVVKGDMSLVGPRPVPDYEVACYRQRHYKRLCALPGITGWWQVHGRGRTSLEQMIEMDIRYAEKQSILLDLRLLARTVPAVIRGSGAR